MKHIILIALIFFNISLYAQENVEETKPKIGLVLSGGGAKGFAHIGVLKVIDSLGIKVDHVAGTSMGAIIGSLYASGYTGKQLDSIFRTLNFDDVISDNLPREAKTFYERDNAEKYAVSLPFDKFKLKLPSAISRGQNVYNLLTYLTLHVSEVDDFQKLPIPFFCIATDVETGKEVILDKGNLAKAITASGAFPSLFQPVEIDGQLLIDGGVVNNYPIDELRAKGMDIIIGVDVQDGLATRDELTSAPDILLQINNYRTINDMKSKVKKTDVYIKPDIKDFTVISFSEGSQIVENGEHAASQKIDELVALAKTNQNSVRYKAVKSPDSILINSVNFDGNKRYTRSYVLGKLRLKQNSKVSYEDFNSGVNNLVATNNFDAFQYKFKKSKDSGGYDLDATLKESKATTFLKLGLHYDDLYKSAALVNITKKRFLFDNDVASFDFILGDNVRYNFEYFIDKGFYWSIGLRSRFNQFQKGISAQLLLDDAEQDLTGINKLDVELQDQTNQFYLQTLFRKDFAFSVGAEHKRLRIKSETIIDDFQSDDDEVIFENTDYLSLFGGLKLDTYSNKYFPKKGFYFNGDFHLYLHASNFNKEFSEFSIAKADIGYAFSFSDKFAVNLLSQGGFKIGDDSTKTLDFALGGYGNNFINNFISFYGYENIALTGNSFVKGTITLDYELFKKHHIIAAANYANIEDGLFESGGWISKVDYSGYALGYSVETFLGPLEAKYTWSPENNKSIWVFNIGFWF
ncbi:patatin-like phospholipase family protein [Meridianimaribacter flavus]|uniref:NTE family protein n=1 Tax=Meridianimaribacter flavus TaxID=571115 RepID=A0ABY2G7K9_9FLAO|nr:patatin-like phospholipase family protein [Meridianimaribacter flavus]TDY13772.1 NTE family protein [Meridianimaribacter flavus]